MENENLKKYQEVFMRVFEVDEQKFGEEFVFGEVEEWNSLAHMTLISELEDVFGIMLESDDIINYHSYENGINILRKYGIEL